MIWLYIKQGKHLTVEKFVALERKEGIKFLLNDQRMNKKLTCKTKGFEKSVKGGVWERALEEQIKFARQVKSRSDAFNL